MTFQKGHKLSVGNKGGHPLKFKDPVAFDKMVDEFFIMCEETGNKPTIEHLAVYMDTNAKTLGDYSKREEYASSYNKAMKRCLAWLINDGLNARNPAMHIFLAKHNYQYSDKQQIESNVTGGITVKWEE